MALGRRWLHEAAGADPDTLLQDAAWRRRFGDAKSKAYVMHFRVDMPELRDLDGLFDQAVDERPQWMASITDQPAKPGARHEWTNAVRQLVAYRDRYQVTDTDSPLGPAVGSGDQGTAYRAAQVLGSITRDEETSTPSSAPSARSMDRVAALLAEARARAAENDARQAEPSDRARRGAAEMRRRELEREQQDRGRDDGWRGKNRSSDGSIATVPTESTNPPKLPSRRTAA